jgi:hypothetical protein
MALVQSIFEYAAGMWFAAWAFRKRYELDYKLNGQMQLLRWVVVCVGFALTFISGASAKWLRLGGGFTALFFLCWPNLAYHAVRFVHRRGEQ